MNHTNAVTRKKAAQRIHSAPNQSSSWPLSRITCRQPVHTASRPKPRLSNFPTFAFLIYGGSLTKRLIMNTASAPTGMLM